MCAISHQKSKHIPVAKASITWSELQSSINKEGPFMEQLELQKPNELECFKDQLQEIIKPYQQEQNRRQKRFDFLKKCVQCIEKNDFFQMFLLNFI